MNFIDICSGIGGFRTGLERNGHNCIAFAEIDKFAVQSYKAIYNTENEVELNDVTTITDEQFRNFRGQCDIITGGFPCQTFSIAGNRSGFDDTREQYSFTLLGRLKKSNHLMYSWKTSKAYYHTTKGELTEQSFKRSMNSGISLNGSCLTVNTGEFHRTENEYIS